MESLRIPAVAAAALLALVCVCGSVPVAAADRMSGQFWTYDASMLVLGVNATGSVTYEPSGRSSISVDSVSHEVDIMRMNGTLKASGSMMSVPYSLSAELAGAIYEDRGSLSVVREDTALWANISLNSTPPQVVTATETLMNTTYSPSYMSGFDPSTVRPGDSWTEQVKMHSAVRENGTFQPATAAAISYSFVVAASAEQVVVPAGTFEALRITASDSLGGQMLYWWSDSAQNFVLEKQIGGGDHKPVKILSLRSYKSSSGSSLLVPILAGLALTALAVVLLVVILRARKPKGPVDQGKLGRGQAGDAQGKRSAPPTRPVGRKGDQG